MLLEAMWPRGGWVRASRYVQHRLHRLPDRPERIARGISAGVFTTFTPFYGLHFVVAGSVAFILRGNIIAALLGTFFGNPLTYLPIGIISMKTGYWILGMNRDPSLHGSLGKKFGEAGGDLWHNLLSPFSGAPADWHGLSIFYDEVFFPYLIGGIAPGIVAGVIVYYVSVPLIRFYQTRRTGTLKAKLASLKKKKKQADGGSTGD